MTIRNSSSRKQGQRRRAKNDKDLFWNCVLFAYMSFELQSVKNDNSKVLWKPYANIVLEGFGFCDSFSMAACYANVL